MDDFDARLRARALVLAEAATQYDAVAQPVRVARRQTRSNAPVGLALVAVMVVAAVVMLPRLTSAPAIAPQSALPGAEGGVLQGTWDLAINSGPATTTQRLLVSDKGTGDIEMFTLDGYPYGTASIQGSTIQLHIAQYKDLSGTISPDRRTITGAAPDIGVDRFVATKVADAWEAWSDPSSFAAVENLRIPVGRWSVDGGGVSVSVNGERIDPHLTRDRFGGYWTSIPFASLPGASEVRLEITRTAPAAPPSSALEGDVAAFIRPSTMFDSAEPTIVSKSAELTAGATTRQAKARAVFDFITNRISYRPYMDADVTPASGTLRLGYGVCMNQARLFVALSRAAGVPARTVEGIFNYGGRYDEPHEWAEYLADDERWHPVDVTGTRVFNLDDTGYLDLVYDREENPWSGFGRTDQEPYQIESDVFLRSSSPLAAGHLGFREAESGSGAGRIVVENVYTVVNDGKTIRFQLGSR